eukprot:1836310-Pleurochrysis_carterae.AAC.2
MHSCRTWRVNFAEGARAARPGRDIAHAMRCKGAQHARGCARSLATDAQLPAVVRAVCESNAVAREQQAVLRASSDAHDVVRAHGAVDSRCVDNRPIKHPTPGPQHVVVLRRPAGDEGIGPGASVTVSEGMMTAPMMEAGSKAPLGPCKWQSHVRCPARSATMSSRADTFCSRHRPGSETRSREDGGCKPARGTLDRVVRRKKTNRLGLWPSCPQPPAKPTLAAGSSAAMAAIVAHNGAQEFRKTRDEVVSSPERRYSP